MTDFRGWWRVVSSPEFDDSYLWMEVDPWVSLHQSGAEVEGDDHVGLQSDGVDGRVRRNETLALIRRQGRKG